MFYIFFPRLVPGGMFFGAPPCSLLVGASSSVHRRSDFNVLGATYVFCVRLSNRIWQNMAECLAVVLDMKRDVVITLEQPSASWGFKLPFIKQLTVGGQMILLLF